MPMSFLGKRKGGGKMSSDVATCMERIYSIPLERMEYLHECFNFSSMARLQENVSDKYTLSSRKGGFVYDRFLCAFSKIFHLPEGIFRFGQLNSMGLQNYYNHILAWECIDYSYGVHNVFPCVDKLYFEFFQLLLIILPSDIFTRESVNEAILMYEEKKEDYIDGIVSEYARMYDIDTSVGDEGELSIYEGLLAGLNSEDAENMTELIEDIISDMELLLRCFYRDYQPLDNFSAEGNCLLSSIYENFFGLSFGENEELEHDFTEMFFDIFQALAFEEQSYVSIYAVKNDFIDSIPEISLRSILNEPFGHEVEVKKDISVSVGKSKNYTWRIYQGEDFEPILSPIFVLALLRSISQKDET